MSKINNPFVQNMYKTLKYLKNEDGLKQAIVNKEKVYVNEITPNNSVGQRYINPEKSDKGIHEINYSPYLGSACVSDNEIVLPMDERSQGAINTPAFGFLEEVEHFLGYIKDNGKTSNNLFGITDPLFDNAEERRVKTGPLANAAISLGETQESNHSSVPVIVDSPTSHNKKDDINKIKIMRQVKQTIHENKK